MLRAMRRGWVIGLALGLVACGQPRATREPTFEVDAKFLPHVNVTIDLGEGERDGAQIVAAGAAIQKFGKELVEGKRLKGIDFETIDFTVLGPDTGDVPLGRKLLHMSFRSGPFRQSVRAGKSGDELMAEALDGGIWAPGNLDIVNDYCADARGSRFCARFGDD